MEEIISGDSHLLGFSWIITMAMQLFFFAIAWTLEFDKVTDLAGSLNFILLALLSFFYADYKTDRQIAITSIAVVARLYLAAFLFYRVLRRKKDARFDRIRTNFFRFLFFWVFQMLWAWGVSVSVVLTNTDAADAGAGLSSLDWVGIVMASVGLVLQVVADLSKYRFRADPSNSGHWCDVGLWKYSRHPNFFGEILLWWGLWVVSYSQTSKSTTDWALGLSLLSPLLTMFILLLLSGMPTAEGANLHRFFKTDALKTAFKAYRDQTSPLVPLPTALYSRLPHVVKRFLLFEWTMYEPDWSWTPDSDTKDLENYGSVGAA